MNEMSLAALSGLDLEGLSPEILEQLSAMGALGDEQGILKDQIATAEALRYQNSPEGTRTRGGYVAANPLQHLATGIQRVQAAEDLDQYKERQGEILGEQTAGREQFMQMILANALKNKAQEEPTGGMKLWDGRL